MNYPYFGATPGKLLPINPSLYVTYPLTYSLSANSNGSYDSYRPYSQMSAVYDFGYRAPNDAGVRMGGETARFWETLTTALALLPMDLTSTRSMRAMGRRRAKAAPITSITPIPTTRR